MSLTAVLGLLLAISLAGDAVLAKLYVGAKQDTARVQQAYDSFKAQVKVEGEAAEKKARAQESDDKKRRDAANAENDATRRRLSADITRVRADADRARSSLVPAAPTGSRCPPDLACFDRAGLELALREYRVAVRGLADEAAALEADLTTARKWAQAR